MMNKLIEDNIEELQEICRKNSVAELYIFGSALTSDFSDQSDLDFAYVLKEDLSPIEYGDAFFGLMEGLENLFERNIDLVSYRVVKNPIFKQELDRTKKSLYAAA
ncbi:MAG: nucleotidyltransferase domain-containing protein [Brumimicrobium sp.]